MFIRENQVVRVSTGATPYPGVLIEVGRRYPGMVEIIGAEVSTPPTTAPTILTLWDAKSRVTQRWTITFSGNPADGETLTHTAAPFGAAVVFEFDNNDAITAGRVPVKIGATAFETAQNLASRMERFCPGNATFTDRTVTAPVLTWETYIPGNTTQLPTLLAETSAVLAVATVGGYASGATIDLQNASHTQIGVWVLTNGNFMPINMRSKVGVFASATSSPAVVNVHFRYVGYRRLSGLSGPTRKGWEAIGS